MTLKLVRPTHPTLRWAIATILLAACGQSGSGSQPSGGTTGRGGTSAGGAGGTGGSGGSTVSARAALAAARKPPAATRAAVQVERQGPEPIVSATGGAGGRTQPTGGSQGGGGITASGGDVARWLGRKRGQRYGATGGRR